MSNKPQGFVYSKLGDSDSKDLTHNIKHWLDSKDYDAIFNSPEFISYVNNISRTHSGNSFIDKDEWFAMGMMILWKNIDNFKLDLEADDPVAKFKTWVRLSMGQVFNYTGKYYRYFVNMSSCGQGFGDLSDSPYKDCDGALTEGDFTLNVLIKERLEELGLNERNEDIIKQYYYDNDTQEEIAKDFGLSRRRIREILEKI